MLSAFLLEVVVDVVSEFTSEYLYADELAMMRETMEG